MDILKLLGNMFDLSSHLQDQLIPMHEPMPGHFVLLHLLLNEYDNVYIYDHYNGKMFIQRRMLRFIQISTGEKKERV